MEIRRVLQGENIDFSSSRPTQKAERKTAGTVRPSADRLELSRQWVEQMQQQNTRFQTALLSGGEQSDKDTGGILGYMETEEEKLEGLSEALDIQMKCLKIAMNMMKGKKVPPEDERYLMEHDPNGYKVAIAMKALVKEDKKECESVLDDEDKDGGKTEESSDSAEPASSGETASSSGDSGVE